MTAPATCRWCDEVHAERYLCDPAAKVLLALYARGVSGDMPTIEWPEPIPMDELVAGMGLDPGDRLLAQVTAAIVLSGRTSNGEVLPRWVYAADAAGLRRVVQLVKQMTELAIRHAKEQRRAAG